MRPPHALQGLTLPCAEVVVFFPLSSVSTDSRPFVRFLYDGGLLTPAAGSTAAAADAAEEATITNEMRLHGTSCCIIVLIFYGPGISLRRRQAV